VKSHEPYSIFQYDPTRNTEPGGEQRGGEEESKSGVCSMWDLGDRAAHLTDSLWRSVKVEAFSPQNLASRRFACPPAVKSLHAFSCIVAALRHCSD
jgi:hypothetical protein